MLFCKASVCNQYAAPLLAPPLPDAKNLLSTYDMGTYFWSLWPKAGIRALFDNLVTVVHWASSHTYIKLRSAHGSSLYTSMWICQYNCHRWGTPQCSLAQCLTLPIHPIGAGVIGDISSRAERGGFFGIFTLGPTVGVRSWSILVSTNSSCEGWTRLRPSYRRGSGGAFRMAVSRFLERWITLFHVNFTGPLSGLCA